MTANLLTLNTSKTKFLLIELKQQLAKFHNCPIETTHYARNLGIIFDEYLTFSDQISSLSKSCNSHISALRCILTYLNFKTASTIATSIIHSKLDYCNSLYFNLPNSQINRLQQIQNSLAYTVVKSPGFSHITPVIKSLHWLKVKERIEYKLLSVTYKVLTTSQPTFSLLAVLDPRLLSPYADHLLSHLSKLQTVLFNTQHLAFGINSLTLYVSLIHILVFLLTTIYKSDSHCQHHLCHHQSFLFSDLKHTSSSSLFHRRLYHRYSLD